MTVKEKLIDLYIEIAWDITLRTELKNKEKVRILSTIIHDDIPSIERLEEAGAW